MTDKLRDPALVVVMCLHSAWGVQKVYTHVAFFRYWPVNNYDTLINTCGVNANIS